MSHQRALPAIAALAILASAGTALPDEIKNPEAVYAGLDKITGRVVTFDAAINETVQFGTLQITPRACYSKPATEAPQTVSFLQVDELTAQSKVKRIFSGWIFSASPGLNGIEHPVYDVWLLDCKGGVQALHTPDVADAPIEPSTMDAHADQPDASTKLDGEDAHTSFPPAATIGRKQRQDGKRGAAPAFTSPPIEVGAAPGDEPAAVSPPGPLPPALIPQTRKPMRRYYPATQDDTDDPDGPNGPDSPY